MSNRSKKKCYITKLNRRFALRANSSNYSKTIGNSNQPTEQELKFLEAAEYGDVPTLRRMLEEPEDFDVNCVDLMGENALQLACGNEHLEIVELLIEVEDMKRVGDALLLAISRGYVRIVEEILAHPAFEKQDLLISCPSDQQDKDFYAFDSDGTRFSPDISPIILAAQCSEFEIIHLLLCRGAVITRPHFYCCQCTECRQKRDQDSLSFCLCRLNAYKALASPAFMSIAFADPACHALKLSNELNLLARIEKEFKQDYLILAKQCNSFLERLLDLCRTSEEVQVLLDGNPSNGPEVFSSKTSIHHRQLKLAIKNKVKKFVAHPNCQQQLKQIWTKDTSWTQSTPKPVLAVALFTFLPVLVLLYLFAPNSQMGRTVQSPVVRFAMQGASYLNFILLLVLNVLSRIEGLHFIYNGYYDNQTSRTTQFTWCESAIMVYIAGMFWSEAEELITEGFYCYFSKLWNLMDVLMLSVMTSSFACRFVAYQRASRAQSWWTEQFGENVTRIHFELNTSHVTLDGRVVDLEVPAWAGYYAFNRFERKYWESNDLQLVAEALYSYGIVLSVFRISYILDVSEKFGPLQISLSRTISDIGKWCGIFGIMFSAFIISLYNLYGFYHKSGKKDTTAFTTLEDTFITLFWSLFGLADYHGVEILYEHELTRVVGYQLYGVYNIITVVVMLNMLVAMLNRSYAEVECDSDSEWKFSRAELMLSYFRNHRSVLPVPYNLIPTRSFVEFFRNRLYQIKLFRKRSSQHGSNLCSSRMLPSELVIKDLIPETLSETNQKIRHYELVVQKIIKRYILHAQLEQDTTNGITDVEFRELKHDVSSFRFEMLENSERILNTTELLLKSREKDTVKC